MIQKNWGTINKENIAVKETFKVLTKQAIGNLSYINPTKKPVFIFSNRRGGSTLAMEMIYSQPGVDFINQPLDLTQLHQYFGCLPHPAQSKFVELNKEDQTLLLEYFSNLLSGHLRLRNQWRILDPNFSFYVNRLVFKVCNANPLINWFITHFDIFCLYLVRHPIPVAMSIMKRGWDNTARAYLENEAFCKKYLNQDQLTKSWQIINNGTQLQQYVLEWCLENFVPLRFLMHNSAITLTYEELVMRPKEISKLICKRFDLPAPERMLEVIAKPSRTTIKASKTTLQEKGPSALVHNWMQEVSSKEIDKSQEILNTFGISAYEASTPYPNIKLCQFGSL